MALCSLLAACAASGSDPLTRGASATTELAVGTTDVHALPLQGERRRAAEKFGDAPLLDQAGRERRVFSELVRDRVVVVSFVYTRCQGSCPGTTANLVRVRDLLGERFGRDVTFVTFSLDPERDTPSDFADYAARHGITDGWTFLTGGKERLEELRKDLGFYDLDPVIDADRTQHAATLIVGNEPRARWMHVPAALPAEALVRAIERVAK
ncbi:MAG: SCO family protein [Planctomycetes bacterium]|nr:SCO family protein [Planctomycetota bacterium]